MGYSKGNESHQHMDRTPHKAHSEATDRARHQHQRGKEEEEKNERKAINSEGMTRPPFATLSFIYKYRMYVLMGGIYGWGTPL